jgi:uncharacterized protein YegP (UPF0339 family)
MSGRFVLRNSGEQLYFRLETFTLEAAARREVVLTGARYAAKSRVLQRIEAVRANAPIDHRYQRRQSAPGQPYFVLRAANNEVLGTSETYTSRAECEAGIALVKAAAPLALLEDETQDLRLSGAGNQAGDHR